MKIGSSNPKRGSVIAGALILAIIGAAVVASNLKVAFNEYKLAQRTLTFQSAMNLAEAGLEEGVNCINTEDWSGWTAVGTAAYFRVFSNVNLTGPLSSPTTIFVENPFTTPVLCAEGRIVDARGNEIFRQIRVDLERASLFNNGMMAKETISFGGSVEIDAYDSSLGAWNATTNRLDEGSVATLDVNNGAVDLGNADIWGYLATGGGTPDVGAGGSVMGEESTVTMDPNRISDSFFADLPDVTAPIGTVEGVNYIVDHTTLSVGDVGLTGTPANPVTYHIPSFSMGGSSELRVIGPTVIIVDGLFSMGGSSKVTIVAPNGSLEMYAAGDVDIGGGSVINSPMQPEAFQLWGTAPTGTTQAIDIQGGVDTAAAIYAPNADLTYGGSATLSGAIVAKTIDFQGSPKFHYDIQLKGFTKKGDYTLKRWRELRGVEELDFTDATALASIVDAL